MGASVRDQIEQRSTDTFAQLSDFVMLNGPGLCVIKAPPGSGKTFTLLRAVEVAAKRRARIAIAAQTNAQADDVCRRLLVDYPRLRVWRLAGKGSEPGPELDGIAGWVHRTQDLPPGPVIAVSTTAKWSISSIDEPFDLLFVDEAWQMSWADFMTLAQVSGRFVLIGDPGQIPPVVTVPVNRWETSPRAPHLAAPDVILADPTVDRLALDLTACRRLPADSVDLVRRFYDFDFDAWAEPGERWVKAGKAKGMDDVDRTLDLLSCGSAAIATIDTSDTGPPLDVDRAVAAAAVELVERLISRGARISFGGAKTRALTPADIGMAATHRAMNMAMLMSLDPAYRGADGVRVDTPERWQGLERPVMVVVHPLSGVAHPSAFDLETGRLCVMASRHQSGMIVVTRDHVPSTLQHHIPSAEQAVGRSDVTGRGHAQHIDIWDVLATDKRVVAL